MLHFYKGLVKSLEFLLNIMFVFQITLMIVVFLTATYWFLDLINCSAFEFARPLAESISDFVRLFYQEDIEIGGVYIDGSLLLFDILALMAVYLITKTKFYVYQAIEYCESSIKACLKKIEEQFNLELKEEAEEKIMQCNNVAILVQFEIKNKFVDYNKRNPKEKEDATFKIFYSAIKSLSGCRFAKTDDKMLILLDDFSKIDNLLKFVDLSINRIRENLKKDKWALLSYIGIDVYNPKADFKTEVLPILEKLLALRHKNEALCLGNFNLRYKLNPEQMYTFELKGSYNVIDECDVFSLIKKD